MYIKSYLIHGSFHNFYKNHDIKKNDKLSFKLKYFLLVDFLNDLDHFSRLKTQRKNTEKSKVIRNSFRII